MGVNALIILPHDTRVKDIALAIGILAGIKPEWGGTPNRDSKWVEVKWAEVKPTSVPEMVQIDISSETPLIDGESSHYTTYHYEPDSSDEDGRLLYPRSTAFWIACGLRLIQFFGGSICYNDCGDCKPNERAMKPRKRNNPTDGKPWDDFQNELFNLKPITKAELNAARALVSYK